MYEMYLPLVDDHERQMPQTRRKMRLLRSYAPDWIITAVLSAAFFSLDKVHGYQRRFSVDDPTIHFPFATHERIPNWALYIIAIAAPAILQALINLGTLRSFWDLHNSWLGLALGLSLTGSITQVVKLTVGRPRPDLLDRCQPVPGSADPVYGLSSSAICTVDANSHELLDGFRSFPSGHSSLSFAGLGFLAFYLAGKLHLFDRRGYVAKAWLALTPFLGAAMVAISRTMDSRHHWQDVLVGSLLGTVVSFFAYRQYYPCPSSEVSHLPYAPRIDDTPQRLPKHHREDHHPTSSDVFESGPLEGTVRRDAPNSVHEAWRAEEDDNDEVSVLHAHQRTRSIPLETV